MICDFLFCSEKSGHSFQINTISECHKEIAQLEYSSSAKSYFHFTNWGIRTQQRA